MARAKGASLHLHLDTFSGIAGNMLLAALLDAGLSRKALEAGLAELGVPFRLRLRKAKRGAIAARYLYVLGGEKAVGHRTHAEIHDLIDRAKLADGVRDRAQEVFSALAKAEAKIHGIPVAKIHFHEVGSVDALVDIVGACIALDELGIERVTATPPALGHGSVDTQHGRLPLPAPATLELLRGIPTVPAHVAWETVTPTGAALLSCLVDDYVPLPEMVIERVGYGAGDDREGPMPNVLRAVLGCQPFGHRDRVSIIESQLDDLPPEHYDHVLSRLLEEGALDVSLLHTVGKKNRPGFAIRILCRPADRDRVAARLFLETPALGLRYSEADRWVLEREIRRVETPFGRVRVKLATAPDGELRASAEYDDCRRAARRADVPLADVFRSAEAAALKSDRG